MIDGLRNSSSTKPYVKGSLLSLSKEKIQAIPTFLVSHFAESLFREVRTNVVTATESSLMLGKRVPEVKISVVLEHVFQLYLAMSLCNSFFSHF